MENGKRKERKMMLVGFAADHTDNTYKMLDPIAKTMWLIHDMHWMEWKIPDPYHEVSIFNQQPDAESDPGIDNKEYPTAPPLARTSFLMTEMQILEQGG